MLGTQTSLSRAGLWFANSGIQEPSGGVARYYHSDTRKNAPVSTEITGYAVCTLLYLHRRTGTALFLDRALHAGEFLAHTAWNEDLQTIPFEHSAHANPTEILGYFFDCGIVVRGLIALWRATANDLFLDRARRIGLSMFRDFYKSGTIHPIVELPSKTPRPYQKQWSKSPGCYQLKSALAWFELASVTGESQFAEWYEMALAAALLSEQSFLPAPEGDEKTMDRLHAYCYLLEGLLPVAGRPDIKKTLADGIGKVRAYMRPIRHTFIRSDVYAQLLRARLYSNALAGLALDRNLAGEEAEELAGFQCQEGDPSVQGGFHFGRKQGAILPFVNPVSTAFCLQAQEMWLDFENKSLEADWRHLI